MLLETFTGLLQQSWAPVFSQQRTAERAVEHGLSLPLLLGRRTVSRTLCALGRADQDWSADYKLFSRSAWEVARLFDPVLEHYLLDQGKGLIPVGLDDSAYAKTGKRIAGAHWQRDPLSPPFQVKPVCCSPGIGKKDGHARCRSALSRPPSSRNRESERRQRKSSSTEN
jgi:hypothetical protein